MSLVVERKFLLPSEYYATKKPMILGTVLGSCVSICMHHTQEKFAAMNHFVLPFPGSLAHLVEKEPGKYGTISCEKIIRALLKIDQEPRNYTAQLFGGGAVTGHLKFEGSVGARNIEIAEEILEKHRIRVTNRDVGGTIGRKISFDTFNNVVECREIKSSKEVEDLRRRRKEWATREIRVLIVDDSASVRNILRKAIDGSLGMEVVAEAANPYEARSELLLHDPDVILLDIIMPRMNGLDFLKKLAEFFPKPVIIVSTIAKKGSDIARRAIAYGAMDVVDKDKLAIYQGLDVVKAELIPKIRNAMIKFKPSLMKKNV